MKIDRKQVVFFKHVFEKNHNVTLTWADAKRLVAASMVKRQPMIERNNRTFWDVVEQDEREERQELANTNVW